MNAAATIFAAWQLNPPTEPAAAEPINILLVTTSTKLLAFVLRTEATTSFFMTVSQVTDLPRPSILQ